MLARTSTPPHLHTRQDSFSNQAKLKIKTGPSAEGCSWQSFGLCMGQPGLNIKQLVSSLMALSLGVRSPLTRL